MKRFEIVRNRNVTIGLGETRGLGSGQAEPMNEDGIWRISGRIGKTP
jgi:hypothetical protein